MEAAPPAPASPEPTMITVYLRLLAGLTSFISKRCLSHFFSMGPEGMLAFSSMHDLRELLTIPVRTATGKEMFPTTMRTAKNQAAMWARRM